MALHVPKAPGFAQMLKEGAKHFSGLEEAVYRNIQACKELAQTTRTAYGPNGMNKMVINHLEKLFVTNDAATILRELEVQHPAAKMIVMASHMQEQEVGDGTNFVLVFAGALLELAEELLRIGLSVSEVIEGYEIACKKAHEILPDLVCCSAKNLRDVDEVSTLLHTSIMSKQYGNEVFLAKLIAQACVSIFPDSGHFNVDNIRVCKILGSGIYSSSVLHGMVFKKETEGDVTSVKNAKIAVYSCPFDGMITETKGTVLIKTAEELMNFSKGEENLMDSQVKAIADTGANVIVTGGKVADMALHYANKYNIMLVRLNSKWDLRRLCKTVGATALPRLTPPVLEEMGHCDSVYLSEVGDTQVVVFKHEKEDGAISTIVLRGSTDNLMDDIERAIDDGVNTFKVLTRDKRLVPGGGATEIELAKQITSYGETRPGLEQYAIKKFAEAFEAIPRALAENSGVKANEVISKLYAVHQEGNKNVGLDIEAEVPAVKDMLEAGILDTYLGKYWAIKLATNAAITVLRVDQIIMAKLAGGPKAPKPQGNWDKDDWQDELRI
ncbi:T-complex protein 1 subunit theta isoform X1 [Vulpes vulpes]|nr:T-complex protein 1 subunit theta isoform X1 [Canis lupus familiaris]XP_025305736.1 T-complex protein 1 subunit theta isoform X1 [Canis lupus dingo]XP_038299226.1 T-complex protein 1 subunit theta isoform X1 [Canis lupus familiaris]XP_038437225.1 T-complex protein 1 subunit theta isoform X1 [Canis lupus familiaris]XP_041590809.1 T-complex protein 1 subunit theta isoform X1 [Vulpes lagopus]|eukprot:XP_005638858.2 T-complex protein 1 subunit theta isoform X1 [Canis lupus familiaris]